MNGYTSNSSTTYVISGDVPNAETIAAITEAEMSIDVIWFDSLDDLMDELNDDSEVE